MEEIGENDIKQWSENLHEHGFLVLEAILNPSELDMYRNFCNDVIDGKLKEAVENYRHDLGSHVERKRNEVENIVQVMWPCLILHQHMSININDSPLHVKANAIAKGLLGDDMELDFDMLITKEGKTDTETPWHSDESYWPDMPDKRTLTFWFPMRDINVEDGCMWFVPGSHQLPMRKHRPVTEGQHVLMTDECSNEEGVPQPLKGGGCTVHTGRTLHYTSGNTTDVARRAYIVNYRPKAMIEFEREQNFDHGKAGVQSRITQGFLPQ